MEYAFEFFRNSLYFVQSELVELAPDDIPEDVFENEIYLDKYYDGLEVGRWVIVAGERTDIRDANGSSLPGVHHAELRTISGVKNIPYPNSSGDTFHTVLSLDKPLAHSYKRSTVIIYGNVVEASHGETVPTEVLGSGNAAVTLPRFQLRRSPLTYVSAPTTSGVQSTETIRVNSLRYQRVDSLLDANDNDRVYELIDDATGIATLTFGSPLPTGQENIRASYRVGIGSEGNVKAEQISLLADRPLGVQGVINPIKASGGADHDGVERIRRNIPLVTRALGPSSRLVSVSDYASFALRFAGIGHADARKLAGGWVHVTVAGVDDIPLDEQGDLLTNLRNAYREFGDPALQVAISVRELKALIIQARVVVDPDTDHDTVKDIMDRLRVSLKERFSFERSALGKPVFLSEVTTVMQSVSGVDWVDVDVFGGISENELLDEDELEIALNKMAMGDLGPQSQVSCATGAAGQDDPIRKKLWEKTHGIVPRFLPAQLAYIVPQVPRTLALNLSKQ
ncbi:MAG: putative baseplate assembly protein [Nitrosomonas sp.]|nr:putative baseplate assembly protein [Nitrosomonas sp.]